MTRSGAQLRLGYPPKQLSGTDWGGRDIVVANGSYYGVNTTVLAELNATRVAYRVTVVSGETPTLSIETLSRRDWRRP